MRIDWKMKPLCYIPEKPNVAYLNETGSYFFQEVPVNTRNLVMGTRHMPSIM